MEILSGRFSQSLTSQINSAYGIINEKRNRFTQRALNTIEIILIVESIGQHIYIYDYTHAARRSNILNREISSALEGRAKKEETTLRNSRVLNAEN